MTHALAQAFADHRRYLWGVCYRMTGVAADADDLVQETFARALGSPPRDATLPLRPWLVRVALNLSKDLLRRRRHASYAGPWLPSPIEADDARLVAASEPLDTRGRYDLLESVSLAFLLALEALTPQKRAVLVLRDVLDFTARETAEVLGISETNVRTTLVRARRALRAYDARRAAPRDELRAQTRATLGKLVAAMAAGDTNAMAALLADDAVSLSDGGGEYLAAGLPIVGAAKIARFYAKLARDRGAPTHLELRDLSGMPALVCEIPPRRPREAPRFVITCDLGPDGRINAIHSILASRKLTRVRFASPNRD